jgi:hypothetical protein
MTELSGSSCTPDAPAEFEDTKEYAADFIEKGKNLEKKEAAGLYEDGNAALDAIKEACKEANTTVRPL